MSIPGQALWSTLDHHRPGYKISEVERNDSDLKVHSVMAFVGLDRLSYSPILNFFAFKVAQYFSIRK